MLEVISSWFLNVVNWFKITFSFVDAELLMMVAIVIMAIILLKLLFKGLHRFRVLKVIIAIVVFGGLTFWAVNYAYTHKDLFSEETRFYVYGRVSFVGESIGKIEVVSTKSNFIKGGKGNIIVKTGFNTKVYVNRSDKTISVGDLKAGDIVQVYCKENSLEEDENQVTAVKIVRLYDS